MELQASYQVWTSIREYEVAEPPETFALSILKRTGAPPNYF